MEGDRKGCGTENGFKRFIVAQQHSTRAAAHKNLYSTIRGRIKAFNFDEIVVCSPQIERPVGRTTRLSDAVLSFYEFDGSCLRNTVGHVHIAGDTPHDSLMAFAGNSGLVCKSWLTEMDMLINDARKKQHTRGVNDKIIPFSLL